MGAAGLACACSEMPARAGTGMEVELSRVPQRESAMTPYEIMLSESQERMLLVAARGREDEVRKVFAKWELDAVEIGRVTGDGMLRATMHGTLVADVPVTALADEAPVYEKPTARPAWQDGLEAFDPLSLPAPADPGETLSGSARLARYRVQGMGVPPVRHAGWHQHAGHAGSDAGVLRIKGTRKAVALTTDCNNRFVYLNPRAGAAMAVAEAARNLAVTGAKPLGLTDCLNFGSPERPEILWQFKEAVAGLAEACRALDIPVVGGNVSFYNETLGTGDPACSGDRHGRAHRRSGQPSHPVVRGGRGPYRPPRSGRCEPGRLRVSVARSTDGWRADWRLSTWDRSAGSTKPAARP